MSKKKSAAPSAMPAANATIKPKQQLGTPPGVVQDSSRVDAAAAVATASNTLDETAATNQEDSGHERRLEKRETDEKDSEEDEDSDSDEDDSEEDVDEDFDDDDSEQEQDSDEEDEPEPGEDEEGETGLSEKALASFFQKYARGYTEGEQDDVKDVKDVEKKVSSVEDRFFLPSKVDPALAKQKDHSLEFDPDYLKNELALMTGEPLQDTSDLDDLGKDSLDTSLVRWLHTASMFNLKRPCDMSGTSIDEDIKALSSMKPGENLLRSAVQAGKLQRRLQSGEMHFDPHGKDHVSLSLQADARVEEEKEQAISGVGKQAKVKVAKVEHLSEKAKKILELPIEQLCPETPYDPEIYQYTFNRQGQNYMTLTKTRSAGVGKGKAKGRREAEKKTMILPNIGDRPRLAVLANFYYRIVTYLLTQEGYTWDDDKEWKQIALYLVSSEDRVAELPAPSLEISPHDFSSLEGKTREVLLKTDQFRDPSFYWTDGSMGAQRALYLWRKRPRGHGGTQKLLSKKIPMWLSEADRKTFIGILKKTATHLMDEENMSKTSNTVNNAWNYIVRNPDRQFPGWAEKLVNYDLTFSYTGWTKTSQKGKKPNKNKKGVRVDPGDRPSEEFHKFCFTTSMGVTVCPSVFYTARFNGLGPPADKPSTPAHCSLSFSKSYLDRLHGKADTDMVDGMTVANHKRMQEWLRRYAYEQRVRLDKGDSDDGLLKSYRLAMGLSLGRYSTVKWKRHGPFILHNTGRGSIRMLISPFSDLPRQLKLSLGKSALSTGIVFAFKDFEDEQEAREVAVSFGEYANLAYKETTSVIGTMYCVAFRMDVLLAANRKIPEEAGKKEICDHPNEDSEHACPECGKRVSCKDLQQVSCGVQCKRCLPVPNPELSPEAQALRDRYPELCKLLIALWTSDNQEKSKLHREKVDPVFVEDLDTMIIDVLGKFEGKEPTDFFTGDPIKANKDNRLLNHCVVHRYPVQFQEVAREGKSPRRVRGAMVKGNIICTTVGIALARYTSSAPTMECLLKSMKNRRQDAKGEAVSCLIPGNAPAVRLFDSIPANNTEPGKVMRGVSRVMEECTRHDQVVPHRRKARFNREKVSDKAIKKSIDGLEACHKMMKDIDDADELMSATVKESLPKIDKNFTKSSASPRLQGVAPNRRYGKPVDQSLKMNVYDIIVEMHQAENGGTVWLPQGPDGCFSFLTGEDNSGWSWEKARSYCQDRIRRTILTCNWRHAADPTTNWVTYFLTLIWWAIRQKGVCEIGGQAFRKDDRHLSRLSVGHWIHGRMMTMGWITATPTRFAQFHISLCNIKAESWGANALKSNAKHTLIQEALTAYTGIQSVEDPFLPGNAESDEWGFLPRDKEWLKVVERAASYGVKDMAKKVARADFKVGPEAMELVESDDEPIGKGGKPAPVPQGEVKTDEDAMEVWDSGDEAAAEGSDPVPVARGQVEPDEEPIEVLDSDDQPQAGGSVIVPLARAEVAPDEEPIEVLDSDDEPIRRGGTAVPIARGNVMMAKQVIELSSSDDEPKAVSRTIPEMFADLSARLRKAGRTQRKPTDASCSASNVPKKKKRVASESPEV